MSYSFPRVGHFMSLYLPLQFENFIGAFALKAEPHVYQKVFHKKCVAFWKQFESR